MEDRIRILLVEDDPDWRRGLAAYLAKQTDFLVVGTAETGEEALSIANGGDIDVVLMDIMLVGDPEGIRLTGEISKTTLSKVIMLTSMEDKELIIGAFRAGAVDYLVKSDFAAIPAAVRAAYRTRTPVPAETAEQMREEFRRLKDMEQAYKAKAFKSLLTPSEVQVLSLIDEGLTQTQIADRLVVSIRTVKVHVGNILKKLEETSSREAARKARDMGVFDGPGGEG